MIFPVLPFLSLVHWRMASEIALDISYTLDMESTKWAYRMLSVCVVLGALGITQCDSVSEPEENFSCAGKKTCKEMTSCAEAKFYLNQCGLTSMDGDSDGIPCEVEHCR